MSVVHPDSPAGREFALENPPIELPSRSARQLLVDWANEQDGWVRRLVGEVLECREVIDGEPLTGVFREYLAESNLIDAPPKTVSWLESGEEGSDVEADLALTSLGSIRAVNALSSTQTIRFHKNLTLFFGGNGTGKTGYTRLLKALAGARTAEAILPNVYGEPDGSPRAEISYTLAGQAQTLEWTSRDKVTALSRMAVFDSSAVRLHLDGDLSYLYTPGDLVLFPRIAASINKVRALLDELIAKRRPRENPFVGRFTPGTRVHALIAELGAQTDALALFQLSTLSDQEAAQLESLKGRVSALHAQALPAQLTVAQLRRERYRRIISAATKIIEFDHVAYNQAISDGVQAEAEYGRLATKLFEGAGVPGGDVDVWRSFLLAGEAYREHLASEAYPRAGDACLYCRQALDADSVALIASYGEFANAAARRRAAEARARAAALARDVSRIERMGLTDELARPQAREETDRVLERVGEMLEALETQQAAIGAGQTVQWDQLGPLAQQLIADSTSALGEVETLIADLSTKAEERVEALRKAKAQYAHLRDRIELRQCVEEVVAYVEAARWTQRAMVLKGSFGKLQRSFTQTAKTAGEQFINGEFSKLFTNECIALCAPTVRLEFPGRQGRSARQKTIARRHKPSTVLSEGEQRIIALADFLAESLMRPAAAPLVFDDPGNGLDRDRAGYVVDRLAELSAERQVIVFTHDVWFTQQLLAKLADDEPRYTLYRVLDEPEKGVLVEQATLEQESAPVEQPLSQQALAASG